MAKVSLVEREKKRRRLEKKYHAKHDALKEAAQAAYVEGKIPRDVQYKLQSIPRNASPTRFKRRCNVCGRARSVYRRFGLCRLCLRKFTMLGFIPGLKKSSW
jgi:small subunit ribosomal protein S14